MNIVDVIRTLAGFAWLGTIAIGFLAIARVSRNQGGKGISATAIFVLILALVFTTMGSGLVYVEANQRGVVTTTRTGGVRPDVLQPGLHWIIPIFEQLVPYSISRRTYTMTAVKNEGQMTGDDSITARTKDGQLVIIDASLIYSTDPAKIIPLHINWQNRFEDEVVRPTARNAIRDAVAQYDVAEIVSTKRVEMEDWITKSISDKFAANDLELISFLLRDVQFSPEYAAAIEQKQVAQQQAEQAKLVVEQRKQEAEQARQVAQGQADAQIILAEAQAKTNELIGQSLQNFPEVLQYQYITKLAPGVQTIFIPSGNQFILPLPNNASTITTPNTTTPPATTPPPDITPTPSVTPTP